MRALFHRWWLPMLFFAAVLGGIYAYETWGPRSVNAALETPLIPMLLIAVSLLYLVASVVYQLVLRRWLPALLTAAILFWWMKRLFL